MFTADNRNPTLELPKKFEVHHELELVLRMDEVNGELWFTQYTYGLDLTLRDLQASLKKLGQPWEKGKVFKTVLLVKFSSIPKFNTEL